MAHGRLAAGDEGCRLRRRRFAKAPPGTQPFTGVGAPLLDGDYGARKGVDLSEMFNSKGIANVDAVRSRLRPLPETAAELATMARVLGADIDRLFLGARATETLVKSGILADTRVVAFATHGLVAGELKGLAEPALVLTPPAEGNETDDGLLTASEVAALDLNAEWVILSACNTAAADGAPNADALSGLTKAFFYAGSRTLLVSHWPVDSEASVRLTTRMLSEREKNPGVGRAEALRRSMLNLMDDDGYNHPIFWAPFVVVGEGGTYREEARAFSELSESVFPARGIPKSGGLMENRWQFLY